MSETNRQSSGVERFRGPMAWMAKNPVAANLVMIVIMASGVLGMFTIKQEIFPEFSLDTIVIEVPYPGATPRDVEQGIILALEEAVRGIDGIKQVDSTANEGVAVVTAELLLGADADTVLSDVRSAVDRITTFPEEAEEPTIRLATIRRAVVSLIISGDLDIHTLHELAEQARARLLQRDDITQVELQGVPPLEVSIEISRERLEALGLTLDDVARQIRAASVELPGGGLRTRAGEILVRVADRRLRGEQFADIVIRGTNAGYNLRLGDIATITDGYAQTDQASYFNGQRAVRLMVYRVGDQTPMGVSEAVHEVAGQLRREWPSSVSLTIWGDTSRMLRARIDLLVSNAIMGFFLVLVVLGIFLRPSLAAWIALGIPFSFLGSFALMSFEDFSINMVSLFALIVTLGMVVDDAIVIGEDVHSKIEGGMPPLEAAIAGAHEMAKPVAFSILTTLAAFAPLFFVPGVMGKVFFLIPATVSSVLIFSWLESFFVLPAHLGHGRARRPGERPKGLAKVPVAVTRRLDRFLDKVYRPAIEVALRFRYVSMAVAVASLIITVSAIATGVVPFSFFPKVDGEVVTAAARLPYGAPVEEANALRRALERSANEAIERCGGQAIVEGIFTRIGEAPPPRRGLPEIGSHLVTIELGLVEPDQRTVGTAEIVRAWQDAMPPFPGLEAITFSYDIGPGGHGADIDVQLSHPDPEMLARASEELARNLRGYHDLINVSNSWRPGKPQLDFVVLPRGRSLGLTSLEIARQLRAAFYGAEALREQRGRNELKVMVRFPEDERRSEYDIERFQVRTPRGGLVPLSAVARFRRTRAPTSITREDGRRVVDVTAELAPGAPSPRQVLESLRGEVLPELRSRFPGLSTAVVGQQKDQAETFSALGRSFMLALFVMFAMLAIPFKSYSQPLIIMSAIPFGFVGAVLGHVLMGYGLSVMSLFGIVALAGVVVNNSLVLIDATNTLRAQGMSHYEAIVAAGVRRFRPIMLTSITTFLGLMPMIFETSHQARFLIPMAISLGFGILFSMLVGLVIVPALYLILEDLRALLTRRRSPEPQPTPATVETPSS